jgi:hypothetical protein
MNTYPAERMAAALRGQSMPLPSVAIAQPPSSLPHALAAVQRAQAVLGGAGQALERGERLAQQADQVLRQLQQQVDEFGRLVVELVQSAQLVRAAIDGGAQQLATAHLPIPAAPVQPDMPPAPALNGNDETPQEHQS